MFNALIGRELISYLYNGRLDEDSDMMELLPLADKYDIQVNQSECINDWCTGSSLNSVSRLKTDAPFLGTKR
jgi:hypothetical protein